MSLALNPAFPAIQATSLIIGTAYSTATQFIIQRPVFGALFHKAQAAQHPKEVLESKENAAAGTALATSIAQAALQSYGIGSLLRLTNAVSYKGAAIVGTLVLAVQTAPSVVQSLALGKPALDVLLSTLAVKVLDTIGLALALQAYYLNSSDKSLSLDVANRISK